MSKINAKVLIIALSIVLLGSFLRIRGIPNQPLLIDEITVAFSAVHYMESGQFGPTMWFHPNLRNIVIYLFGKVFGYGPFSLHGMSLITGIMSIPIMGILLYVLVGSRHAALLGAFLLSVEQVHITFSRYALQETWTTFFFLLGVLFSVMYYRKSRPFLLVLSGVIFGLGISSKFHAIPPLTVCLLWGLYISLKERSFSKGLFVFSCLSFIPVMIYLLTFVPWFARGYGFVEWLSMQKVLLSEMLTHEGTFMGKVGVSDTEAWQWFLKPTGYVNFANYGGIKFILLAFSNPFVWLMVLPSTALLIWKILSKKMNEKTPNDITFILLLLLSSYLPLVFSPRPLWLLSSLATIPFAFMIVSVVAWRFSETIKWGKNLLWIYIIIVFLSSIALYPMACGMDKNTMPFYLNSIVEKYMFPFE